MLVQDLNVPIVDQDQKEDRKKVLVDYFIEDRHGHNFYAYRFFLCEFLNLFNVVGQLFFMNFFLGGEFTTYGADVLAMTELEQEQRSDPMSKVFPKVKILYHLMSISTSFPRSRSAHFTSLDLQELFKDLMDFVFFL